VQQRLQTEFAELIFRSIDDEAAQENTDRRERDRIARGAPIGPPRSRWAAKGGENWWDVEVDGVYSSSDDEDWAGGAL